MAYDTGLLQLNKHVLYWLKVRAKRIFFLKGYKLEGSYNSNYLITDHERFQGFNNNFSLMNFVQNGSMIVSNNNIIPSIYNACHSTKL